MNGLGLWIWAAVFLGPTLADISAFEKLIGVGNADDPFVELKTDAPAVLDAPVTVFATLKNENPDNAPFYFSFSDNASPMHYREVRSEGLKANFTLDYPSDMYESGEYTMTVRVYKSFTIFRSEVAKGSIKYGITRSLNGRFIGQQRNRTISTHDQVATIETDIDTRFEVRLYDPEDYLSTAKLTYYWFINSTSYGFTEGAAFNYAFHETGNSMMEVLVLATIPGLEAVHRDYHEKVAQSKSAGRAMNLELPDNVKMGMFRLTVNSRRPMRGITVDGDKWLQHGKLLNLSVSCDGTGPWNYCWRIRNASYNATGDEVCGGDYETLVSSCHFSIVWYFRDAGASAIIIIVDNVLNHKVKQVGINVYDVPRRTPVSLIVVPLCSALIAVIACISGVFVFMTFKRNMTGLETADFDFSCPDEQLEYKTFWERLRDSMLNALSNANKDDVSHVSSVSSRSIQGPPVNIHYGSIT